MILSLRISAASRKSCELVSCRTVPLPLPLYGGVGCLLVPAVPSLPSMLITPLCHLLKSSFYSLGTLLKLHLHKLSKSSSRGSWQPQQMKGALQSVCYTRKESKSTLLRHVSTRTTTSCRQNVPALHFLMSAGDSIHSLLTASALSSWQQTTAPTASQERYLKKTRPSNLFQMTSGTTPKYHEAPCC